MDCFLFLPDFIKQCFWNNYSLKSITTMDSADIDEPIVIYVDPSELRKSPHSKHLT
jgi:hypothetical protein